MYQSNQKVADKYDLVHSKDGKGPDIHVLSRGVHYDLLRRCETPSGKIQSCSELSVGGFLKRLAKHMGIDAKTASKKARAVC